jgi:exopolysaccharide biosynthesis polyprenyl glycosylphosphotransferase
LGQPSVADVHTIVQARGAHRLERVQWVVTTGLVLLDACLVLAAFLLAYWARYSLLIGGQVKDRVSLAQFEPLILFLVVVTLPLLLVKGAYAWRLGRDTVDEFTTSFSTATIAVAAMVVMATMLQKYGYSRFVVVYVWVLLVVLLPVGRTIYRLVQGHLHRRGIGVQRLVVVGATDVGKMVMQSVVSRPDLGFALQGFVVERAADGKRDFGRFHSLGTVAQIPALLESGQVDQVIVALPASSHDEIAPIIGLCERHGVGLKIVPDLFETSLGRVNVDEIAGIPLLDVKDRPLRRIERGAKRLIDITVAGTGLVILSPICALIAVLIRFESGAPTFIRQDRVGLDGKVFRCWKFRTMRRDASELRSVLQDRNEVEGPLFKIRNDPRCTPLGRRLRRLSLDELPQLWNVIRGDMSLVGPRPPLPEEVEKYDANQRRRLLVKPGMTGLWQVSGRSDLHFDEMVMMDVYYASNWSLALDAKILLRTVVAVVRGHGAY